MNTKDILGNIKSLITNGKLLETEETLTNIEMAKQVEPIVTEEVPVTEDTVVEEAPVEDKAPTDAERIEQLEKDVKSLQKDLKDVLESMKPAEEEKPKEDEPVVEMSAVIPPKKFTGAPVEEKTVLTGIVNRKTQDTKSRVFDRMANSKL